MDIFLRIRCPNLPIRSCLHYRLCLDVHFPMLSREIIAPLSSLREKRRAFSLLDLALGGSLLPSQIHQSSLQILIHHLLTIDTLVRGKPLTQRKRSQQP